MDMWNDEVKQELKAVRASCENKYEEIKVTLQIMNSRLASTNEAIQVIEDDLRKLKKQQSSVMKAAEEQFLNLTVATHTSKEVILAEANKMEQIISELRVADKHMVPNLNNFIEWWHTEWHKYVSAMNEQCQRCVDVEEGKIKEEEDRTEPSSSTHQGIAP